MLRPNGATFKAGRLMIQTIAATPSSADFSGALAATAGDPLSSSFMALFAKELALTSVPVGGELPGTLTTAAGDAMPSSFMALFAKALSKEGVAEAADGKSMLSVLLGGKAAAVTNGVKAPDTEAGDVTLALPVTPTALPAAAGLTGDTPGDAVGVDGEAEQEAEQHQGGLNADKSANAGASPLVTLLSLPGLMVGASGKPAEKPVTTEQMTEAPDATEIQLDADGVGKKLPNSLAEIAGQQKIDAKSGINAKSGDAALTASGQSNQLAPASFAASSSATALVMASAAPESIFPAVPLVSATPVSGQEATLMTVSNHAAVPQDKLQVQIRSDIGASGWRQELGDRLVWMTGKQGQMAELILNPPSLGTVEVRLNMSGTDASAQFFSANASVREAIESALPKLREMMSGAGISLGEAMVSNQSFGQREADQQGKASGQANLPLSSSADDDRDLAQARGVRTSLLDYFA